MRLAMVICTFLFLVSTVRTEEKDPSADMANLKPLAAGIQKAGALTVYIGVSRIPTAPLPPGVKAPEEKTMAIRGYQFHEKTYAAGEKESAQLKALIGNEKNFSKWEGPKPCGGFHPNYCLEWKDGEKVYQVFLCYGCEEAKIYGPDKDLYVNAGGATLKAFSEVLHKVTAGK
jgi:hypothetical protein